MTCKIDKDYRTCWEMGITTPWDKCPDICEYKSGNYCNREKGDTLPKLIMEARNDK